MDDAVAPIFFQRFVQKHVFQQEPDEAVVGDALENLVPPVLDWLEGQLVDGVEAARSLRRALELTDSEPERRHLEAHLAKLVDASLAASGRGGSEG